MKMNTAPTGAGPRSGPASVGLHTLLILLGPILIVGCSQGPVEPARDELIGVIAPGGMDGFARWDGGEPTWFEVPHVELEASGPSVTVTVVTFGIGTCTEPRRVSVEQSGMTAIVTPYVLHAPRSSGCITHPNYSGATLMEPGRFDQLTVIRFPKAGEATVIVRGIEGWYESPESKLVELERTIELNAASAAVGSAHASPGPHP